MRAFRGESGSGIKVQEKTISRERVDEGWNTVTSGVEMCIRDSDRRGLFQFGDGVRVFQTSFFRERSALFAGPGADDGAERADDDAFLCLLYTSRCV